VHIKKIFQSDFPRSQIRWFPKNYKLAIENNLYILDGTSHLYC